MTSHCNLGPLEREPVNLRPPFGVRAGTQDHPSPRRGVGADTGLQTWRARQLADRVAALSEPLAGLPVGG